MELMTSMVGGEAGIRYPSCRGPGRSVHDLAVMNKKPVLIVAACIFLAICCSALAQNAKQQMNAIIRDTQKQGSRAGRITIVWWIPPEFWRAAMAASGIVPVDKAEEMLSSIRDVNVFMVIDGKVGPFAAPDFAPAEEVQRNISLTDTQNMIVPLIPEVKQIVAIRNMISMMKPIFANMLGEFGRNLLFVVFEGINNDGSRRIDPLKPGSFTVKLNTEEFRWRLPLGSLLPAKKCPRCNDVFPGNYAFCPFDATPLVAERSSQKK